VSEEDRAPEETGQGRSGQRTSINPQRLNGRGLKERRKRNAQQNVRFSNLDSRSIDPQQPKTIQAVLCFSSSVVRCAAKIFLIDQIRFYTRESSATTEASCICRKYPFGGRPTEARFRRSKRAPAGRPLNEDNQLVQLERVSDPSVSNALSGGHGPEDVTSNANAITCSTAARFFPVRSRRAPRSRIL
jgi:hypothetical protein